MNKRKKAQNAINMAFKCNKNYTVILDARKISRQ